MHIFSPIFQKRTKLLHIFVETPSKLRVFRKMFPIAKADGHLRARVARRHTVNMCSPECIKESLNMPLPLSLASIFFPVTTRSSSKIFSPIIHHNKRDICKIVDRTYQTANKVNYDSLAGGNTTEHIVCPI